jgi:hypothetical protein
VNVYPFIEAEKSQQHNVKRACILLKVPLRLLRRPSPDLARRDDLLAADISEYRRN